MDIISYSTEYFNNDAYRVECLTESDGDQVLLSLTVDSETGIGTLKRSGKGFSPTYETLCKDKTKMLENLIELQATKHKVNHTTIQ